MKKGFTLAEVLIALAIIGVVAALTVPSIMSHNQQMEFKTGLRKAVSVLNSAIQANIAYDGETPYDNGSLANYLKRHMSITRTMAYSSCHGEDGGLINTKEEDGTNSFCGDKGGMFRQNVAFYTTDGMRFEFPSAGRFGTTHYYLHESNLDAGDIKIGPNPWNGEYSGYCGSYGLAKNPNNTKNTPCVILVDVNGDRKPNPPQAFDEGYVNKIVEANGTSYTQSIRANQSFVYSYVKPDSKKVNDLFSVMITDKEAIPFGVVAQRAMYNK